MRVDRSHPGPDGRSGADGWLRYAHSKAGLDEEASETQRLIAGRRTGVRLGSAMWEALKDIAHQTGSSVSALVTEIDRERKRPTLDVAIRNYVVAYYRAIMRAARYGDAGQRCPIIPVDDLERKVTEPSSGTPKVIPTRWQTQPLHGVYAFVRQVALLLVAVLPITLLGGAIVPTDL